MHISVQTHRKYMFGICVICSLARGVQIRSQNDRVIIFADFRPEKHVFWGPFHWLEPLRWGIYETSLHILCDCLAPRIVMNKKNRPLK